jgi:hypothetical protein
MAFPWCFVYSEARCEPHPLSILGIEAEGDTPENHKAHPHGKVNRKSVLDEALLKARIPAVPL